MNRFGSFHLLLLALAFAIITTVGIAWWSAWRVDLWEDATTGKLTTLGGGRWTVSDATLPSWELRLFSRPGARGVLSFAWPKGSIPNARGLIGSGPSWSRVRVEPNEADIAAIGSARWEDARGWPLLCLRSEQRGTTRFAAWQTHGGIRLPLTQGYYNIPRALPLVPIWPGLLGNVLISFVAFILFYAAFIRLRAARRLRHHRCPRCAYPMGSGSHCTECGAAVSA